MRCQITVDDEATARLARFAQQRLPEIRRGVVEQTARQVLADTIRANPVDTARSRAAWVTALEELGGTAPADWRGEHPSAENEGRNLGSLTQQHDQDVTEILAINGVEYVPFLEYGTARIAPFGMVRRTLFQVRATLADLLRRAFRS